MMAGCYSLDLYCDNKADKWEASKDDALVDVQGHRFGEFPHQYTDELGSVCRADAKKAGWKFFRDGRVFCPKCNKRKALP